MPSFVQFQEGRLAVDKNGGVRGELHSVGEGFSPQIRP